jgi:hypothetical protein
MALWSVVSLFQWFTRLFGAERCVFVCVCVRVNFSLELQSASVAVNGIVSRLCHPVLLAFFIPRRLSHTSRDPQQTSSFEAEEKYHMAALIRAPVHGEHLEAKSNKIGRRWDQT